MATSSSSSSFSERYEIISGGCFGIDGRSSTSLYKDLNDNEKRVVVKKFDTSRYESPNQIIPDSLKNIDFKNRYFINYFNIINEKNFIYLITEYYDEGTLQNKIVDLKNRNEKISLFDLTDYSIKILKGLEFLHSKNIVHQRLNPANIYFKQGQPVLGYNGIKVNSDDSPFMGNLTNYVAPEILIDGQKGDFSSDIWSYGCVLYFMIFQKDLFENRSILHVREQVDSFQLPFEILDQQYNSGKRQLELQFNSALDKSPKKRKSSSPYINELIKIVKFNRLEQEILLTEYDDLYFTDSFELLSGSWDNTIKVWDTENNVCTQTLTEHQDTVNCLEILPNNKFASGSEDGTVVIWRKSSRDNYYCENQFSVGDNNQVECLKYVKLSNRATCSNRLLVGISNGEIYMFNLDDFDDQPVIFSGHQKPVRCLVLLLNSTHFASGSRDGSIMIWSLNTRQNNHQVSRPEQLLNDHEPDSEVTCFKKLSNGIFASGSTDSFINIYMAGTNGEFFLIRRIPGHSQEVKCMCAISPNLLIAGYADGSIILRDLNSEFNNVRRLTPNENSEVECLQLLPLIDSNPNMKRLASGHRNGSIIIWMIPELTNDNNQNIENNLIHRFERVHNQPSSPQIGLSVYCLKIVKKKYLASGGEDGRINILSIDPFDYQVCETYDEHNDEVVVLALN